MGPSLPYTNFIFTVIETPTFVSEAEGIWSEEERLEFISFLARDPEAGVVIPGSGSCRKVRWSRQGTGKSGGVRVIYFVRSAHEELWLLLVYPKSEKDNVPAHTLRAIRREIENG